MTLHRLILVALSCSLCLAVTGICCVQPSVPDQSAYRPLSECEKDTQALVRVYAAPIPHLRGVASHSWFVIKPAGATEVDRWEVWQTAGGPHGHVRKNLLPPESDVGSRGVYIVAEATGREAEPIATFIAEQSPAYPCRNTYAYLGVNSNTYVQWVLDQTGWPVALPRTAIGKGEPVDCPSP